MLINRIQALIDAKCGTGHGRVTCFAGLTGINVNTIRAWLKRGVSRLSKDNVEAICKSCNISADWLLYGKGPAPQDLEVEIPESGVYNKTPQEKRVSSFLERKEIGTLQKIPVVSYAQAGAGGFPDDSYEPGDGEAIIMFPHTGDPHAFALVIRGDSMLPKYHDGDVVVISPARYPTNGRPAMIKLRSEEATVKEWHEQPNDIILLKSLNQAYQDRAVPRKDIEKAYKIVGMKEGG